MSDEITLVIKEPPKSKCGRVKKGKTYVRGIGGGGWGGGEGGVYDKLVLLRPARGDGTHAVTGTTKRSTLRVVYGPAVKANEPEVEWLIAGSRTAWLAKEWDKNWREMFGMPWSERRDQGVLSDITDIDRAQQVLLALKVTNRSALAYWLHQMVEACYETPAYAIAMGAYNANRNNRPAFYILARLHEFLRSDPPEKAIAPAMAAVREIAPFDFAWMKMR